MLDSITIDTMKTDDAVRVAELSTQLGYPVASDDMCRRIASLQGIRARGAPRSAGPRRGRLDSCALHNIPAERRGGRSHRTGSSRHAPRQRDRSGTASRGRSVGDCAGPAEIARTFKHHPSRRAPILRKGRLHKGKDIGRVREASLDIPERKLASGNAEPRPYRRCYCAGRWYTDVRHRRYRWEL